MQCYIICTLAPSVFMFYAHPNHSSHLESTGQTIHHMTAPTSSTENILKSQIRIKRTRTQSFFMGQNWESNSVPRIRGKSCDAVTWHWQFSLHCRRRGLTRFRASWANAIHG